MENVKAHQEEVQQPATTEQWEAYANQRADHWANTGRELHDINHTDAINYTRTIHKTTE